MTSKSPMKYNELSPHAALRPYIRSYFHLQATGREFLQPADGCPSLMISLGDPFELGLVDGKTEVGSGCLVLGPFSRRLFTRHTGRTSLFIVKFLPGQFDRFFDVPAIELSDACMDLESLWGKTGRHLEQRLVSQNTGPEVAKLLDGALLSRLSSYSGTNDELVPLILDLINRSKGQVSIDDLAGRAGLSRRHMERRFADSVGLPPKRMCRIARFLNAFSYTATSEGLDWAELAYSNEYSDQAHLIRECKFFTGYSPVAYLKKRSSVERSIMCTVSTI